MSKHNEEHRKASEGLGWINAGVTGTLYVSSMPAEQNPLFFLKKRLKFVKPVADVSVNRGNLIQTSSASDINAATATSDYIFIDPPFGNNLMYSELNFLWEAWLRIFTNNATEAIICQDQQKGLFDYQSIMEVCFKKFFQILKPGRWMTVEFHNSQNSVWNSIQEGLLRAGFMVADVRTLDKQQGSFKQVTSSSVVKQDLVISSYKPSSEFEEKFKISGGSDMGAWSFIRQHLEQLSLPQLQSNYLEPQAERMPFLLYDRLVAFHLVRGLSIPLSAGEFYAGLGSRFLERDGMYFTPTQAAEYDRLRLKAEKVEQLTLFVTDEQTAIQWLHQVLDLAQGGEAKTYAGLQPEFLKQLHQEKYEKMPELMVILEQNFLQDEQGRWYAPDPDKQADMEALRQRALLREFAEYLGSKGKLKVFRSEAVRAGFSKAWKDRDYATIVKVGERMPEAVLQEDPKLKMYYDNALGRAEREPRQESLL